MSFWLSRIAWISPDSKQGKCGIFTKDFLFKQSHSTEQQPQSFTGKMPQTGNQQATISESMFKNKQTNKQKQFLNLMQKVEWENAGNTIELFIFFYCLLIVNFKTNSTLLCSLTPISSSVPENKNLHKILRIVNSVAENVSFGTLLPSWM